MAAAAPTATPGAAQLVERVQDLQARLESAGDSAVREVADELMSAVVRMYGAGLERIMTELFAAGADGERIAGALAADELVATLLLIHDLHPIGLQDRVQRALDSVRPYMESHGGNVQLLSLTDGVARIHLQGSCSDCSASSVTLELAIKAALEEAAPDLEGLEVVGVAAQTAGGPGLPMVTGAATAKPTGMELPVVMSGPGPHPPPAATPAPAWFDVEVTDDLTDGSIAALTVAGSGLVVANVDGTLLAYRDRCAGCGGALHGGRLSAGALACPSCQRSFFLPRAGRSMDDDHVQLEPVPLLRDQGRVKVALAQ
jgi:Fe-S cluster biogenesis protein NfuA/nitrite reductase/ring-hydroxylating ferredoxin subunit